jgi:hypothetical protein
MGYSQGGGLAIQRAIAASAARLVVLPAMSHVGISGASGVLVPMVTAFLDDEAPVTPQLF